MDTDSGIGKKGQTIAVYRTQRSERFVVGHAKIVRFQKGMTALKVTDETPPYQIRVGDAVDQNLSASDAKQQKGKPSGSNPTGVKGELAVSKVVQDYVLVEGDVGQGRVGEAVAIRRRSGKELMSVGTIRVVKVQAGKTVGRIVAQFDPLRISVGDFIPAATPAAADDLDYYFFGPLEAK